VDQRCDYDRAFKGARLQTTFTPAFFFTIIFQHLVVVGEWSINRNIQPDIHDYFFWIVTGSFILSIVWISLLTRIVMWPVLDKIDPETLLAEVSNSQGIPGYRQVVTRFRVVYGVSVITLIITMFIF
jgi:hypothetical protein